MQKRIMQGDQYRIPIELKHSDNTFVTQKEIKDMEIFVGNARKMLSRNEVVFEPLENVFYVYITQEESFRISGEVSVQARLLFLSGDVIGIDLGKIDFIRTTSKVVLK